MTNEDEARLTDHLPRDAAQTFVDFVQGVRFHSPSLLGRGLIFSTLAGPPVFDLPHSIKQTLDLPVLPPRLRKKCLGALCYVCGRRALLPS